MNSKSINNNLLNKMNNDEQHAFDYLLSINEQWAQLFLNMLLESRDKISQRLISSLHRENLIDSRSYSKIISNQDLNIVHLPANSKLLSIAFPKVNKTLYATITGNHAFDRLDVQGPFYIEDNGNYNRVQHPNEILNIILTISPELDNDASTQFYEDLNNSVTNMAIALSYQAYTLENNKKSLYELIMNAEDSYLSSEQFVIEGHPIHPGAKLRKGMSPETVINYSAEFSNAISLQFVLIHKSIAKVQTYTGEENDLLFKSFEGLEATVMDYVGRDQINQYYVMVVHPWQYDHILLQEYKEELKTNRLIPIDYQQSYYAGLSFRTLMPKYPKKSPHIKLSTNVHITGEIRTLSEQTTINGPQVTHILNDIKQKDSLFKHINADTIDELAGIHFYNSLDKVSTRTKRSEQLGTLFRTNIYHLIKNETTPIIPSALVSSTIYNNEPLIVSLINKYKEKNKFPTFEIAALSWINQYGQALIDITIPLYVKYGIALEAHLQNSIATFSEDGRLDRLYIRDFEGLRIDRIRLNKMGYSTASFHEKSLILSDQPQTVFNKVFYSSIQNHLGELIVSITKSSENSNFEKQLWQLIRDILIAKLNDIANDIDDQQRVKNIKSILLAPKIDYKCVTTMRLTDEADYYTYIKVDNPLHQK
ncbi:MULTISPECIES: IucA/IucC family protein [Staphylococcus]|uniref:Sialic acid synthase n=1 Tax=Staphylococcus ureilyticus TaxID=94138 RepID=A0AB34AHW9_STAUR|nr:MULTISPECIES: IucA/IucC family protein [Staphylococcus]AVL77674.1 sialic acid synthase [Staphylococcus cohnii]MBL0376958.1 sialic acid synthase [Staphylococcus sp. S75]MBL0383934.1 sialic acid synthase [Staphylococcus sp. S59]MBL0400415.1 sialic acid synthase [Staphylococcus sp. S36]MCT1914263.1 sialic acid synthase [Staphylococcus ureilyticus]